MLNKLGVEAQGFVFFDSGASRFSSDPFVHLDHGLEDS